MSLGGGSVGVPRVSNVGSIARAPRYYSGQVAGRRPVTLHFMGDCVRGRRLGYINPFVSHLISSLVETALVNVSYSRGC